MSRGGGPPGRSNGAGRGPRGRGGSSPRGGKSPTGNGSAGWPCLLTLALLPALVALAMYRGLRRRNP